MSVFYREKCSLPLVIVDDGQVRRFLIANSPLCQHPRGDGSKGILSNLERTILQPTHFGGQRSAFDALLYSLPARAFQRSVSATQVVISQLDGNAYSVFTSGAYRMTAPNAAFPQEKPHFATLSCSE